MKTLMRKIKYLFDIRLLPIRMILFNIIMICGILGGVLSAILTAIAQMPLIQIFLCMLVVAMLVFIFVMVNKTPDKLNVAAIFIIITVVDILFPVLFFYGGGVNSGASTWFMIGMIFTFLLLTGPAFWVMFIIEVILFATCFMVAYCKPELVTPLKSNFEVHLDALFSMYMLACIVGIVVKFQNRIYNKLLITNEQQKDELTAITYKAERARHEALMANESKSRFLAKMSHEIRTPINAVLGMDEMIIRESNQDEIKNYATDIKSAAQTLLSIINDILDSSKIESGKMELVPVEYDLGSIINDLVNMITIRANDKNLQFNLSVNNKLPSAYYGDDVRIRQVLLNILTNAVKYTDEGSVTMIVDGKIDGEYAILHFEVKDTGIGIKKEDLPKLFGAYDRIDERRNHYVEGTGLGMSITTQLLKLMESELQVKSIYGVGSTFYFDLKQKIINNEPIGDFEKKLKNTRKNSSYHVLFEAPSAKVLVVDDNAINRTVFRSLMKQTKIQVKEADSGKQCLKMVEKEHFDIIFMDHMMPEMDGVETLAAMKALENNKCKGTPVVMLTANAVVGAKDKYMENGFDAFLSKPIAPDKLESLVYELLSTQYTKGLESWIDGKGNSDDTDTEMPDNAGENADKSEVELPELDEFDWDYAKMHIPDNGLLIETIKIFYKSMEKEINTLESLIDVISDEQYLDQYRIAVHSLKSTTATIGATILSRLARLLEVAAKEKDYDRIYALHPIFIDEMKKHRQRLSVFKEEETEKNSFEDMEKLEEMLYNMKDLYQIRDFSKTDDLMNELVKFSFPDNIQGDIDILNDYNLNLKADDAIKTIDAIIGKLKGGKA